MTVAPPIAPLAEPGVDPVLAVLRERFGLDHFRPWQREAIDALLRGAGRVLVVAPTGGGKSLTYQVPGALLDGMTLVLSPLVALMEDQAVLGFLRQTASTCRYITSVCTGSLVLGAAGLLKGYRATTHWASHDQLALLGAEPVDARVVIDRNRITGAGVTSGIDFALAVVARLAGEDVAKQIQLSMEYDPEPPFAAGSPAKAGPIVTAQVMAKMESFQTRRREVTIRAAAALERQTGEV